MNRDYYIYGLHTCVAEIESSSKAIKEVFISRKSKNKLLKKIEDFASNEKITVSFIDRDKLTIMCQASNHQGVAMKLSHPSIQGAFDVEKFVQISQKPIILIIDNIQDPHNLGAILRTAWLM